MVRKAIAVQMLVLSLALLSVSCARKASEEIVPEVKTQGEVQLNQPQGTPEESAPPAETPPAEEGNL